jgi:conjugal transfer pilus assembly protein TraV
MSAVDAYKATDKSNTTIRSSKGEHANSEEQSVSVVNTQPARLVPAPKIDDPTPIRTPSKVMRVWIAPWEDSDGDLNVSGYVYTEIEPRRWMVDKAPTQPQALTQFQVKHREKTAQNNGKMNNVDSYSKSGRAALGRNSLGGTPNPSPLLLMQSPQE